MAALSREPLDSPLDQDTFVAPAAEQAKQPNQPDVLQEMMNLGTPKVDEEESVVPGRVIEEGGTQYHYEGGLVTDEMLVGQTPGGPLAWPVQGTITSRFLGGFRSTGGHSGVDIAAKAGTPVLMPAGAVVTSVGYHRSYGNNVLVTLPDGTQMRFAHLQAATVRQGQQVGPGQSIGFVGSTGNSTGPHLHFEVIVGGRHVDPLTWLGQPGTTATGGPTGQPGRYNAATLNYAQLTALAQQVGFTAQQARVMAAIAMGESGGRAKTLNNNQRTGDLSYGLWQINMLGGMGPERRKMLGLRSNADLYDPLTNARAAFALFQQAGNSFRPWSVFNSGAYRKHLK